MQAEERARFIAHAEQCPSCRAAIAKWQQVRKELVQAAGPAMGRQPDEEMVDRLLERAEREAEADLPQKSRPYLLWGVGAAALAAGFAALVIFRAAPNVVVTGAPARPREPIAAAPTVKPAAADESSRSAATAPSSPPEQLLQAPKQGRLLVPLGEDVVAIGDSGSARVVRRDGHNTRVALETGTIACSVAKRTAGGSFAVEAGDYLVWVVGTRFSVSRARGGLEVTVLEGTVVVSDSGDKVWLVEPNRKLSISGPRGSAAINRAVAGDVEHVETLLDRTPGATAAMRREATLARASSLPESPVPRLEPAPAVVPPNAGDQLGEWGEWVVSGRFDEASTALLAHLKQYPDDAAAWSLLADCRRKSGKWSQAIDAYQRVLATGRPDAVERARYMIGVVLQDRLGDQAGAAAAFEQYLSLGKGRTSLEAAAMVRLARSRIALGQLEQARALLRQVVARFKGTPMAEWAKKLLAGSEASVR